LSVAYREVSIESYVSMILLDDLGALVWVTSTPIPLDY
jgi:hypothetical protein